MKKILISRLFFFILGALIFGLSAVFAYSYISTDVGYTPLDNTWEVDNVKDALDDLHLELDIYNNRGYKNLTTTTVSSNNEHVIYSSQYPAANEYAYCVFDGVASTFWTSDPYGTLPQYVGWDFLEKVAVYEFAITNRSNTIDTTIGNFTLQGYRRGNWEDIQSYTHTDKTRNGLTTYKVDYPKYYYKYRIYVTSEGVRGANYVQVTQVDFKYIKHNID